MATISNATLRIDNVTDTTVRVTVSYNLVPNQTEKLANTVFQEKIEVLGDDSGKQTPLFTFADGAKPAQYAVDTSTTTVSRSRDHIIPKSTLNEDPGYLADGAEDPDEVLAQITISYAANAPSTPALPAPAKTPLHPQAAWV
jgi:hypothetical protein